MYFFLNLQVSAHAMNNMGPTAQIISRTGWSTDMDFVGHRKAVSCVVSSTYHIKKIVSHSVSLSW